MEVRDVPHHAPGFKRVMGNRSWGGWPHARALHAGAMLQRLGGILGARMQNLDRDLPTGAAAVFLRVERPQRCCEAIYLTTQ